MKNDLYTISFLYKNTNRLDNAHVTINGEKHKLNYTGDKWQEFIESINVTSNTITIEFDTDTNQAVFIADLMGNLGEQKQTWEQNANETITDTVQIGKGIQVNSSTSNTYTRIDADGNKGLNTDEIKANKAELAGLLIQKVSSQIWLSSLL